MTDGRSDGKRDALQEALAGDAGSFRALIERNPEGIALCREGRFVYANAAFVRLLGYDDARELVGEPTLIIARADLSDSVDEAPPEDEPTTVREQSFVRKDGSLIEVELAKVRVRWDRVPTIALLARDVTARKQIEARLRVADRVASIGTLAAGVAHEINNPLASVIANLEFVADALEPDPPIVSRDELRQALRDAREGAARVHGIVDKLRSFALGDERPVRGIVDVRNAVRDAESMANVELRPRARVVMNLGPVPLVEASSPQLVQVFVNLLINAAQAIPDGRPDENEVRITTTTSAEGHAVISIADTGVGIPSDAKVRIFDPFFTTKPVGVGTGLGLSVCIGIIHAHGGTMAVESAERRGTNFTVTLPPAKGPPAASKPKPAGGARRARVLVVDDDALVAGAIRRSLRARHDVVVVTTAREALERIAGGEEYDAIVCDLVMPEMTGMQLYAKLETIEPALAAKILFITGGAFTPAAAEFLERVPNPRLEKPLDMRALERVLTAWLV